MRSPSNISSSSAPFSLTTSGAEFLRLLSFDSSNGCRRPGVGAEVEAFEGLGRLGGEVD